MLHGYVLFVRHLDRTRACLVDLPGMYLPPQDVLFYVKSVSLLAVSGFICWVLYEFARMLRQANDVIEDARDKMTRVEQFVSDLSERVGSASQYLGVLASAGKEIFGFMRDRRNEADSRDEDRDWAEEVVKRRRKRV